MQRNLDFNKRSEDEEIKDSGLTLDFDEIAKKKGMSAGEKNIAKWYGIYTSRQPGNHMMRMAVPGGVITSSQARKMAEVAETYGQGTINITTRQAIQFHWLKVGRLADVLRELNKENISTKHGCGDVTRNVAACPFAENCRYAQFDVRPIAQKAAKYLTDLKELDNLPRKFKITFSGCTGACGQPYINCVGTMAVKNKKGQDGFQVVIGGGMGWKPFVAQHLYSFVPKEKIIALCHAIGLLFRDHGDRFNRAKARLKFVVHRYGIEKCRAIIEENLEKLNVAYSDFLIDENQIEKQNIPSHPISDPSVDDKGDLVSLTLLLPKGSLNYKQFERIAELSEIYADQKIYTTNKQNIVLQGIEKSKVQLLKDELTALNIETEGAFEIRDITVCVGTTYCPKAVSKTHDLHDWLQKVVRQEKYSSIAKAVSINITGCPNSCSPYRIADIGFRGMRIREEMGSVEGYELLLGGSQTDFGKKLGDFKATDCAEIVGDILDLYIAEKKNDEDFTDYINRNGIDYFKEKIYEGLL